MSVFAGFMKQHFISLVAGVCVGVLLTFTARYTAVVINFLPNASIQDGPHCQPLDHSPNWTDERSLVYSDDTVAQILYHKVRVLCWVMTHPGNIHTKAIHVNNTWGKRCNVLLFMSSKPDAELPVVALNVHEGRQNLWAKTKAAFKYIYEHHLNDADWFLKADDDTYIVVENLRYFLQNRSPLQPVFFGGQFIIPQRKRYMSGGAGYVLSKAAVTKAVTEGFENSTRCKSGSDGDEDVEMGRCLFNIGVKTGDSRDELGRERFHPFVPEQHLIPGMLSKNKWFNKYSLYTVKQGRDCCSDYTISFHYVPPSMMYVLEYLIYHLKSYGINTFVAQRIPRNTSIENDHKNVQKGT